MDQPTRRKQMLVDRKLQFGMSLRIVCFVYVYLTLFALIANLGAIITIIRGSVDEAKYVAAVERLQIFVQVFVLPLALTFLCMCLHGVFLTHRVAGPIYRLRMTLRKMRDRVLPAEVHLREKDYFKDLCDEMNGLLQHLCEEVTEIRKVSSDLASKAEELKSSGALPAGAQETLVNLTNGFSRLRRLVDGYTIEGTPPVEPTEEKPVGAEIGSC